jgi:hypothetical protein
MRPDSKPRSKVHELVLEKLRAYGEKAVRVGQHQLWCNVDYLKVAVLDALDQVGCKYLVHTRAIDAVVEDGRVTGVVVATKRGPAVIRAKAVVDCTGDADVAYYAGAETMKELGSLSPITLCLNLTNVTTEQVRKANIRDIATPSKEKVPTDSERMGSGQGFKQQQFLHQSRRDKRPGPVRCDRPGTAHAGRVPEPTAGSPDDPGHARIRG